VKLHIGFGTGKHFCYVTVHQIVHSLGPQKALALPMFHALTGSDTVSSFAEHGKKTACSTWHELPQLTNAPMKLLCVPKNIPMEAMMVIERFAIF